MINFKNKNVLITGATGGIGGELVKKFTSLFIFFTKPERTLPGPISKKSVTPQFII